MIVIGDKVEAVCYARYCREHGIAPTFFMPSAADITSAERTGICSLSKNFGDDTGKGIDVISFGDDLQIATDVIRRDLGLPYRDLTALRRVCSKAESRSFPPLNVFLPKSMEISMQDEPDYELIKTKIGYPLVIKPSNAYYSAGVTRCDSESELKKAFRTALRIARLMSVRRGVSSILVQEYIDGEEFAVDGFVYDEKVIPVLMHSKYPRLKGPLFHEYAVITKHLLSALDADKNVINFATSVISASGLDHSPFHMEFRMKETGEFVLLEIAPRLSGGGTTGFATAKICAGLDFFEILRCVNNRTFYAELIAADRNMVSLEYDFASDKPGRAVNLLDIQQQCLRLGTVAIYEFKSDGDYVRKEGEALGSCLLSYFQFHSWADAEDMFDKIHANLSVQVA